MESTQGYYDIGNQHNTTSIIGINTRLLVLSGINSRLLVLYRINTRLLVLYGINTRLLVLNESTPDY